MKETVDTKFGRMTIIHSENVQKTNYCPECERMANEIERLRTQIDAIDLLCFLNTERDWAFRNKIEELRDMRADASLWSSGYQSAIESVLKYIEKHNSEDSEAGDE